MRLPGGPALHGVPGAPWHRGGGGCTHTPGVPGALVGDCSPAAGSTRGRMRLRCCQTGSRGWECSGTTLGTKGPGACCCCGPPVSSVDPQHPPCTLRCLFALIPAQKLAPNTERLALGLLPFQHMGMTHPGGSGGCGVPQHRTRWVLGAGCAVEPGWPCHSPCANRVRRIKALPSKWLAHVPVPWHMPTTATCLSPVVLCLCQDGLGQGSS